jgi:osmotically-inducible protein OsmY
MPHRDRWSREPDRDTRRDYIDTPSRADAPNDDFGQADYSTDYGYDPRTRTGYRAADDFEARDDFGQADYSEDFGYDAQGRAGYRRSDPEARRLHEGRYDEGVHRAGGTHYDHRAEDRSFMDQARDFLNPGRDRYDVDRSHDGRSFMDQARDVLGVNAYRERRAGEQHRQGRVIWAVINGRMDHERRLDARDIEVIVDGNEVILNGTVRSRDEKRLAEDLADVRGISHVQNNLRIRHHTGWWR